MPRKTYWMMVLNTMACTLLALIPIVIYLCAHVPPKMATVDIQKLIEEDQQHLLKKNAQGGPTTPEQQALMQSLTSDFAKKISEEMEFLNLTCNCVLINRSALLLSDTVHDYTDLVRQRVQR